MKLKRKIPDLEKSNLVQLNENQLRFKNAVYDLMTGNFQSCDSSANIFNRFSIPIEVKNYDSPVVFDKLLDDITGGDALIKQLVYEIIGAILSNSKLLKRIYVFQGVSNGGKTRLMKIIAQLLEDVDVAFVNTISEVTGDQFKKLINSKQLICVNDSADKKLASLQISYLKSFADGNVQNKDNVTKIIMATNYAITSGSDKYVETALKNRFLVVPFKKSMDNTDADVANFEDEFLENEKLGIVCKALGAFGAVIRNGRKFCCEPLLNDPEIVVACDTRDEILLTDADRKIISTIKHQGENFSFTLKAKLNQIFDELFILTEDCNLNYSDKKMLSNLYGKTTRTNHSIHRAGVLSLKFKKLKMNCTRGSGTLVIKNLKNL